MWTIDRPESPCNWLDLEPVRVLYEYDGPRIFTCKGIADELFLAFQCGWDGESMRFLVAPFSEALERQLEDGDIDVRDALSRPGMWVFDLNKQWVPVHCWRVNEGDLPAGILPRPGVTLRRRPDPVPSCG